MKERILVVSDIHGHRKALVTLLKAVNFNVRKDQLVLMGDYVNNGPDSFGTLKLVKRLNVEVHLPWLAIMRCVG